MSTALQIPPRTILIIWALFLQAHDSTFDVASIRPAAPNARGSSIRMPPGGGFNASNVTLRTLIGFAYQVRESEIYGGPDWIESERYDLLAKPDSAADDPVAGSPDVVRQRLRALLTDRFGLSVHFETRQLPVFALMVAKGGPRLSKSGSADERKPTLSQRAPGEILAECTSMQTFASALTEILGRIVQDHTGLAGTFDFKLMWESDGSSIFTALQEQLGLRLASQKGPVTTIVIDRAQKPSAN